MIQIIKKYIEKNREYIRTIKENITTTKQNIDIIKNAGKTLADTSRQVPILEVFEYDGNKVLVTFDELFVRYNQCLFCTVNIEAGNTIRINTDNNYINADVNTRKFIIYHEIGHYKCNHLTKKLTKPIVRVIKSLFGIIDINEAEADDYAVSIIGREGCLEALINMRKVMKNNRELDLRIYRLLN